VTPARDLRATSDHLLRDLELLGALEEEKRTMSTDDPRLVELAVRIEEIAVRVLGASSQQRELTESIHEAATADAATPATSIDEVRRPISEVLAEWRAAERRQSAAEPGSVEASEAAALVEHCRNEYRRAREAADR
jgi:hypothetical protein